MEHGQCLVEHIVAPKGTSTSARAPALVSFREAVLMSELTRILLFVACLLSQKKGVHPYKH